MGPRSRREKTLEQLIDWFDRLDDILPPTRFNPANTAHALTRYAFLTLLRSQVRQFLVDPVAYDAAKHAIRAWVSDDLTQAVRWLTPACGEPVQFSPAR